MVFELQLRQDVDKVEAVLQQQLSPSRLAASGVPDRLAAAMRHAVLAPAKRFRPFLVMASARLFRVPEPAALQAAAAFEYVHCYSLAHDDLPAMDDDRLRRGLPTVWAAFDEWTAILAGDALLTLAFEVATSDACDLPADRKLELTYAMARAAGAAGMVAGQQLDLDVAKLGQPADPDAAFIEDLQTRKTGALLSCAATAGAILAGATQPERAALARYGHAIGVAFQIADDLLDVEGNAETVGKTLAKDAAAGKATLVGLLGVDAARQRLIALRNEAVAALAVFDARADILRDAADFAVSRRH